MKLVAKLTPEEAKNVLQQLLKQRPGLTKEVGEIFAKLKPAVDADEVAAQLLRRFNQVSTAGVGSPPMSRLPT